MTGPVADGRVDAVCVSGTELPAVPGRKPVRTGIDKRPATGRVAVSEAGLDGDVQVNRRYHGGDGQALYAYAQADADFWIAELGRELPPGRFGENLRVSGLDLTGALIGERWRVGTTLLEVSAPRVPCANLARFWDEPQLVKRFTAHGATGAYLRVLETGEIGAADAVDVVHRPAHGVTTGVAFRIYTTQKHRLAELAPALDHLPERDRTRFRAKVEAGLAARTGVLA